MYVVEGKIGRKYCVLKGIEHQWEKKENNYGTTEDGKVCLPMSVTRSNQGIKREGGYFSNMYKTIE